MPGFVENPFAYMTACDVFVLSSRSEGLSNVLIEAMACGCPVISTDCGGPREILRDGALGMLTPVGDAEALAAAMMKTLEKELNDIDKKERIERAAFFSAERAAGEWSSLLEGAGKEASARQIVLHLITGLHTGGAEMMLCRLLSALDRRRWDPVVISLTDGSGPEVWLREQGIPVVSLGMRAGHLPGPAMVMRLTRLVRRIRPDLIQGWMYHGNLAALYAGRRLSRRVPVIWSIHHSIGSLEVEKKMTIAMIRLGARLSGRPARIIYASQVSVEQHRAIGYRADKAMLIPYGVDPELYMPSAKARKEMRAELGLSPTDLVIGSLARYHPMKDHANFLRAAALLTATKLKGTNVTATQNVRFVLAGRDVDDTNEPLRSLIQELGLGDRVLLLGERQDAHRLLAALDIFTVSSSHGEALPNVLLEAMSCGLPCVTTDVGDAGRLVGDTGTVVAVRDPAALSGAWAALIGDGEEKRKFLGQQARAKIMAHYTLTTAAAAYTALYTGLIKNK